MNYFDPYAMYGLDPNIFGLQTSSGILNPTNESLMFGDRGYTPPTETPGFMETWGPAINAGILGGGMAMQALMPETNYPNANPDVPPPVSLGSNSGGYEQTPLFSTTRPRPFNSMLADLLLRLRGGG